EFAPDGSLYVVDWHNALIGHMQHSARDPLRDHEHGRIYRVTYPSRPLVKPAKVAGASISELLENLKLHEYRARYRTKRELRGRDADKVIAALSPWVAKQKDEHVKLEALWVTWGLERVDEKLLSELLQSKDHRIRSAAVRVLRYNPEVKDRQKMLVAAANDDHGQVRLEAITAGSRESRVNGLAILAAAEMKGLDQYSKESFTTAKAALSGEILEEKGKGYSVRPPAHLSKAEAKLYVKGADVYSREAHCGTCHQANGMGLPAAGFPPLAGTKWATGNPERLIKLAIKGLFGPIEVKGKVLPGVVPMTPFEYILKDDEMAATLTYVRNSFGNKASAITPEQVKAVRESIKGKKDMYVPAELLKEHPHGK
ncbi:MAG: c-type cytochrome, partial [Methylococcales bacterium]|nr:c-type cytochrome [Methylococcales bacterium]